MLQSRTSVFHSFPPHNQTTFKHSVFFFFFFNVLYSLSQLLVCKSVFNVLAVQPMKLGEHLNSLLLNMCDDVTLSRISLRTVLDICSKHIRNSTCDPPFSYIRKLVRLVLGSLSQVCSSPFWCKAIRVFWNVLFLPYPFITGNEAWANSYVLSFLFFAAVCILSSFSPLFFVFFYFSFCISHPFPQLDGLLTDRESLPERSKEIRERLRGKGLPSGKIFDPSSGWRTTCRLL